MTNFLLFTHSTALLEVRHRILVSLL